jgi:3,4-dihydroxy 2-butanone 4-phosphate synthase / GTP cyclohydrolase II
VRPGHVLPLRAREGGVLRRAGHTEAAVDLTRLAGCRPAAAICELANDDGTMRRLPELRRFARDHGLALVSIADLIAYRRRHERQIDEAAAATLETAHGRFRAIAYRSRIDGVEHLALVHGEVDDGKEVLVRVQHECLTGDVFSSRHCDCGAQMSTSLHAVAREGRGVLLYLRGGDRRGFGLADSLRASDPERAAESGDADPSFCPPRDACDYDLAAQMLMQLGVHTVRLLTKSSIEYTALKSCGIEIVAPVKLRGLRDARALHIDDDEPTPRQTRVGCAAAESAWWGP